MVHDATTDDMLHDFADYAGKTDRTIVRRIVFLPLLEDGCDVGVSPV